MAVKEDLVNNWTDVKNLRQIFICIRLFMMKEAQWINPKIRISLRGSLLLLCCSFPLVLFSSIILLICFVFVFVFYVTIFLASG